MITKLCKKCLGCWEITDFYKNFHMKDGHLNNCKICVEAVGHGERYYAKNKEKMRKLRGRYYVRNKEEFQKRARCWRVANPEKCRELAKHCRNANLERYRGYENRYKIENPEKNRAHSAVYSAIKAGKLVRGRCEVCGALKVHAHHDDYSKPLDVNWLCARHHAEIRWPQKAPYLSTE